MYELAPQPAAAILNLRNSWPVAGHLNGHDVALHVCLALYSVVCELPGQGYSVLPAHR
jgi:hypothetical protein